MHGYDELRDDDSGTGAREANPTRDIRTLKMATKRVLAARALGSKAGSAKHNSTREDRGIKGARAIQRTVRRIRVVFGVLGPNIYSRKGGVEADYGEIYFPTTNKTAPFITVADTTSATLLSNFIEKYWKLPRPEVLISVTGGAQDFELSPPLQRVFDRGLANAATATNAWVVTGGTDTGVMKLVASALVEQHAKCPLIGVTSYGCVNGRTVLEGARLETRTYDDPSAASVSGAPLNRDHTHFVFVDSGKEAPAAWGAEISFRANFESTYARLKGVPLVLLVVQGGPGTLATVQSTASLQQAVLVVRDSGGAADAIADYILTGRTDDPKFQAEKLQKTLAQIRDMHRAEGRLGTTSLGEFTRHTLPRLTWPACTCYAPALRPSDQTSPAASNLARRRGIRRADHHLLFSEPQSRNVDHAASGADQESAPAPLRSAQG